MTEDRENLVRYFRMLDKNEDGFIDKDELWFVLKELGTFESASRKDMDTALLNLLAGLDKNGDGFVDVEEFVDWVLFDTELQKKATLRKLDMTHIFLTQDDEARMERLTLFDLQAKENQEVIATAGLGDLFDPSRLILSVGSSSTQAYDSQGVALSAAEGTKVQGDEVLRQVFSELRSSGKTYSQILMVNSIGYSLKAEDPCIVELKELADRCGAGSAAARFLCVLSEVFPEAKLLVFNRAKDQTKSYRYPQLVNDFSVALTKGAGLPDSVKDKEFDVIVDWGGSSFKVFVGGKRVGTEVMDANGLLCADGLFHEDRHPECLENIESYVRTVARGCGTKVLVAQTGKARELALAGKCACKGV